MASSMLTAEKTTSASTEADVDEALNTMKHSCANDPDFAVICDFLQKFSKDLGLDLPNFKHLLDWFTKTNEVSPKLRDMQIKLLRKTRKTVHEKSWESALSKFCFTYSAQDAWEIERFGYKNSSVKVKLRVLRELLECQFERNTKFRAKILTLSADSLRSQPIGRDRLGHAYWVTQDNDCNLRIYQEHLDEEIWQVVATNREEFVNLIKRLRGSEVVLPSSDIGIVDEDTSSSTSQTCSESLPKPPPPEEQCDSQEDEQKVPKLSIKLLNERNSKDDTGKDVGKGEEELAAEEDAKLVKKSGKSSETSESDEGEFEEVEEEYDNESDDDDIDDDDDDEILQKDEKMNTMLKLQKESQPVDNSKKVKPLLISQKKIMNIATSSTNAPKKRSIDQADSKYSARANNQQIDSVKKSRPSLLDSKRLKTMEKYEESKNESEEEYDETGAEDDDDDDIEEEIEEEEEDIDSVAAEEDENEEKEFEDFDDDDDENGVGEEITDPVVRVAGAGSGKECDAGNSWFYFEYELDNGGNENIVGEIIEEEIFYVRGEGYGKWCQVGNNKNESDTSNTITKTPADTKQDSPLESKISETKSSIDFAQPECLKLNPSKNDVSKVDCDTDKLAEIVEHDTGNLCEHTASDKESNNKCETKENKNNKTGIINGENNHKDKKVAVPTSSSASQQSTQSSIIDKASLPDDEKSKKIEEIPTGPENLSTSKPNVDSLTISKPQSITCDTSKQMYATKMSVLESLKKELRESKQKSMEKSAVSIGEANKAKQSSPTILNRKRRLDDLTTQQTVNTRPSNSESEFDINSENPEELSNEHKVDINEEDVGGKRLKMRPKQTNSELRKKVEARKVAVNEETTSSSGGEEESRRRKIILPKKHADQMSLKSVEIDQTSSKKNTNGEKLEELPSKVIVKTSSCSITTAQKLSARNITCKNKPTLDEIIEKKLKKTPEKKSDECVSASSNEKADAEIATKCTLPPPNKCPITKPLKKTLLCQIRQEENDDDAVPRKRTISEDLISTTLNDLKSSEKIEPKIGSTSTNDTDSQKNTPERQRKRRSSEETTENEIHEEPEAKKEVVCVNINEEDSETNNKTSAKEDIGVDKKEKIVNKHSIQETLKPTTGRRSGRRGGLTTSVFVESPQPKRTRGCIKNSTKKDIHEDEENKKDIKLENIIFNKSKDKEKTEDQIDSSDKPTSKEGNSQKETELMELNQNQTPKAQTTTKSPIKGIRKQRDVDATNIIQVVDNETPVRQSRRIAQQKIREEAERRKLEEIALRTMKKELKKKKKAEKESDPTVVPPTESSSESEESDLETKRKVQKKKCPGKNGSWSSGSEEQDEPDEVDEEPHRYETDPGSPLFKSDHEFSPESEIEDESQVVPMKRARTVRKEDAADDELDEEEEEACQKCSKSDHPEWILLCDNCDKGYHCSCLSPVLFYIPEGNWYCPPCQQEQLIKALECQLKEFDDLVDNKRKEEEKEKLKLAEEEKARQEEEMRKTKKNQNSKNKTRRQNDDSSEGSSHSGEEDDEDESGRSSDENVNKNSAKNKSNSRSKSSKKNDKRNHGDRRHNFRNARNRILKSDSDSDSGTQHKSKRATKSNFSSSSSSSSSSSYSESDNEPIYKLRKRRQINVSYRLNEYDDLINSALKKEMDQAAGAGNLGRGKDISTIIEADKEEKARQKQLEDGEPSKEEVIKPKEENGKQTEENIAVKIETVEEPNRQQETAGKDSDDEPINQKFNIKPSLKKKSRKLTTLDISSGDDDGSDEDFKGSSLDDEDEEDTSISASNSDSSLEIYKRHGKPKKKRRKAARRAFRQRRKDRRFVVDESDDEEIQRPKSKKKRKDDSDYTESEAEYDDLSELSENIDSADLCDDTTTDESDGAWRPNNRKKAKKSSIPFVQKSPKPKKPEPKKLKKVEYSDDDISETEEEEEEEEDDEGVGGGKGMGGKQPRSQPLKSTTVKTKGKGKGGGGATSTKTKKKKKSSEDEASLSDSADSTRRTRGRRYAYMEDFDDDSSDGGIKPGVQRPDTPPEEREKFIKRQEEIKRMLAEKNAEGAKLAATPRLTPIKTDSEKDKRSPVKAGDSLSTVPLSVIRQAKVLDIDYLQRRGENLEDLSNEVGEVDDDFDDVDLPNDLPEDMDEDTIARMVEEEEEFGAAAARELPAPDEVLRSPASVKPKIKEVVEKPPNSTTNVAPFPAHAPQIPVTLPPSGLQEPVRKRLPMPTMHPPLLRHQFFLQDSMASTQHLMQRHSGPPTSHLLQSALSAPLTQPMDRNYPPSLPPPSHHSLISRMTTHNIPLQPPVSHAVSANRPPFSNNSKSTEQIGNLTQEKSTNIRPEGETKPRGRRKKITPLRDPLQKQQAAAAVTAATATNSVLASASANTKETPSASLATSVIKSGPPMKVQMQTNVITNMPPSAAQSISSRPSLGSIYARTDGPRFYDPLLNRPGVHRQRGPPQMPPSLLPPHPAIRSSYGPPPPLKGSSSSTLNSPGGTIRNPMHHVPTYVGVPPNARHSAPHLNLYSRPSMYGNPNFGPRVNLRHPNIHTSEYSTGSRAYAPYGFYPPPPPLTAPGHGPPSSQMHQAKPSTATSVIVSATAAAPSASAAISSVPPTHPQPALSEPNTKSGTVTQVLPIKASPSKSASPSRLPQSNKIMPEPRKKLTTLQTFTTERPNTKKSAQSGEPSESHSSPGHQAEGVEDLSSTQGISDSVSTVDQNRSEGHASEFSGLVSYFSSQHDDYNT